MTHQTPILVVDDNLDFADSMADILEARGYPCQTANGALEALNLLKEREFGLVLMDVLMPGVNGVTAFKEMRAAGYKMPVMLITAYSEMELLAEAMEAGVAAILHKPMEPERILDMVNHCTQGNFLLLVDDDQDFLTTMAESLETQGYMVQTASNGAEAQKLLREKKFQLILLDMRLPGTTQGKDIYQYLREQGDQTPVCFVTGYIEECDQFFGALDCQNVLRKPFSPEALISKVSMLLKFGEKKLPRHEN